MIITTDIPTLPFKWINGIKCFTLIAEHITQQILPDLFIQALGYNGTTPGPTIIVHPGDYVQIRVINRLNEPTSIHWHGLDTPNNMDGVPPVEPTPAIAPGSYFDYHFCITNPPGTHMYHSHVDSIRQDMLGLVGAFIIEDPTNMTAVNRDYVFMLHEFSLKGLEKEEVNSGMYELDPMTDNFNFFTINGRCYPFTSPIPVHIGERVRIRLGNIGMNAHPMHLHGHQFWVTATDGNSLMTHQQYKKNTILVASGETYDVEFVTNNFGKWPFHCHIPHHIANNFTKPLGGMFTTIVYQ
ncbi:MAG: multicopper oxidase family protein [Candidatus Pristimantibacillus sp.]